MQNGPNKNRYCAVEYADEQGLVRFAHVHCYNTRDVLDHDAVYEYESDEDGVEALT